MRISSPSSCEGRHIVSHRARRPRRQGSRPPGSSDAPKGAEDAQGPRIIAASSIHAHLKPIPMRGRTRWFVTGASAAFRAAALALEAGRLGERRNIVVRYVLVWGVDGQSRRRGGGGGGSATLGTCAAWWPRWGRSITCTRVKGGQLC